LDEWQVPEPSPYFDVRLKAHLREEMARPAGWMQWFRKPALAMALTVLMVAGITLFRFNDGRVETKGEVAPVVAGGQVVLVAEPGTAVGDLQALDKNHDLYSDFDVLDDLQVPSNVSANP